MDQEKIKKLLAQRDEIALDYIQNQYGNLIKQVAFNIFRSDSVAEECLNDTLMDIWNTIPPEDPESLLSYACMIARRRSIDRVRKATAKKRMMPEEDEYMEVIEELDFMDDISDRVIDKIELARLIGEYLKTVSRKNRDTYIDKIDGTITVGELKANFENTVDIAGKDDSAEVATDDVVSAGEQSLKALIYGDVNRDGKIDLADVVEMLKYIAKWDTAINTSAADVDKDTGVNLLDVVKMLKRIAGWDDISLGNVRMVFENKAIDAEYEDETLQLSFTSIMNKIGANQLAATDEYSYKIKTARNEYESCTVLLYSDTAKEGMTAELSDFVSEYGDAVLESKLEWVVYQPNVGLFTEVKASDWDIDEANKNAYADDMPEVLLSMADTFELKAERLQQFVITTHSTKDTPAGMYKATLVFKDSEGKEVKKADVYAYVYDFTLPDTPYSASLFCGESSAENYEFMLEHNLSDYRLPVPITSPEADAYMSDPRVTAFVIAGGSHWYDNEEGKPNMYGGYMNETDEMTVKNYTKVAANPEWFKKGLFYYTDEPWGTGLDYVKTTYERVTELLGTTNIRNITPLANNSSTAFYPELNDAGIDAVEYIKPYINVWCPQSNAYQLSTEKLPPRRDPWTPQRYLKKYGEYADRAKAFRERGDDIWWYVCCSPEVPYANYFNCYQGVINRLLSWQQFYNNVDGVLYYRMFGGSISKYNFDIGNGDGILEYHASLWGREGYAPSWRLIQIRDGFDDFDYLRMAEKIVGRDKVMEIVKKVSSGMLAYTEDYRVLEACRDEVAEILQGK